MDKKILIASFFVFLMALLPFSALAQPDISTVSNNARVVQPSPITERDYIPTAKIQLSSSEIDDLQQLINGIENGAYRWKARLMYRRLVSDDGLLDVVELRKVLEEQGFLVGTQFSDSVDDIVDPDGETNDPVENLALSLFDIVVGRLGWIYELWVHVTTILADAAAVIRDAINIPQDLKEQVMSLTQHLFQLKNIVALWIQAQWYQLVEKLRLLIMGIQEIQTIIMCIQNIVADITQAVSDVVRLVQDITKFSAWLNEEPWKDNIHITGKALKGLSGYANVDISCHGENTTTNETGGFSFTVSSRDAGNETPQWWIHQRQITAVTPNGTKKETPPELSYVFSSGEIYWVFVFSDDNSRSIHSNNKSDYARTLFSSLPSYWLDFFDRFISSLYFT